MVCVNVTAGRATHAPAGAGQLDANGSEQVMGRSTIRRRRGERGGSADGAIPDGTTRHHLTPSDML
jgi:hypothetical protein